jgi:hypothetical protein
LEGKFSPSSNALASRGPGAIATSPLPHLLSRKARRSPVIVFTAVTYSSAAKIQRTVQAEVIPVEPEQDKDYEYKGHRIELREREHKREEKPQRDEKPELLIDDVPIHYGQLPNGKYFLHDYAFDWTDDLIELARRYIDYRSKAEAIRRERRPNEGRELK